jgi:hypothetical protein
MTAVLPPANLPLARVLPLRDHAASPSILCRAARDPHTGGAGGISISTRAEGTYLDRSNHSP